MKKKYHQLLGCALMVLAMGTSFSANSQVTTTYAVGTTTSNNVPVYGYYGYTYSEQIYLASDFDAAVQGQLNQITTIRFYLNGTSLTNTTDWTIYMGQTSQTDFPSTTSWVTSGGMTQVYSGTLSATTTTGWQEFVLSTPFEWDGVSNIVIGVDENQPSYSFSQIAWRTNATGANRSIMNFSDSNNPNPATPPTASSRYGYVPQLQAEHILATPCSGTPAHASLTASNVSLCEDETVDFELGSAGFQSGFSIVWQYNTGGSWTDFASSTSTTNFSELITQTMDVRAVRTCIASGLFDESDVVTVTMNTPPTVLVDVTDAVFCSGTSATINASGASTYTWSPVAGLNTSIGASVTANPTAGTTYTVTGTDMNGCTNTATSMIAPVSGVSVSATTSASGVCSAGTPITIDASVSPSNLLSGTWEYRFLGSNGVVVLQDWSASSTLIFTPTVDSLYTVYYEARNTGCTDIITPGMTEISVGFGADVTVVDYDCINLEGTINVSNIFGQMTENIIYESPLDAASAELTLSGAAVFANGRTEVTPSQTGVAGAVDISIPGFMTGANNSMKVSFDLTADLPINNYGTGGGDGLTYSFANDALATGSIYANGKGTKLRLIFDAANNGGNNVAGIYLVYGYTGNTFVPSTDPSVLAFEANTAVWKFLSDVPVELTIDAAGLASLMVGGQAIFEDIQMPAAYMNADVSSWKHLVSAHTGGDALRHAISNIKIESPSVEIAVVPTGVTPGFTDFDSENSSVNVQPGFYDVWIAQDSTNMCSKMIGTYEVLNSNPVVDLGSDTTICEGDVLVLDAGNAGATYLWSGSNLTTQTISVSNAGTYMAYATGANSCQGFGTITIDVIDAPSISGIYAQGNFPTMFLSATNPQDVSTYDWDFGDGSTAMNGPSSLSHAYLIPGTYTVTLTISNECGTEVFTESVEVQNFASIDEQLLNGVSVYPNPATDVVTIQLPETLVANVTILSMTGALMMSLDQIDGNTVVNTESWEAGMYFVQVQSEGIVSTIKLVVR